MNYELAKELKEAGFPQLGLDRYSDDNWQLLSDGSGRGMPKDMSKGAYFPTLSELIEACMSIILRHNSDETWMKEDLWFFELAPNINTRGLSTEIGKVSEWRATINRGIDLDDIKTGNNYFGSTPEEAVAKLWLALNKK